jgi:hypothetical protein
LLALLVGILLLTDLLARDRALERLFTAESRNLAEKNHVLFSYTGNFIDFEERLMLDEIPMADYSKGGAYFFGTSNMKWAFQTWDLPADQRQHIGNYGIGASNHTDQLQFIRYLIDYRGFLSGGDRDLVVLGVSFHLAHVDSPSGGYWASLLRRRGLYGVSTDGRITPAPMGSLERWLRIEQARCTGFVWNLGRLAKGWVVASLGLGHGVTHNGDKYRQAWRDFMGPRWQKNIDEAMVSLRDTISLVRSKQAKVEVVLLPQGTWMAQLPFGSRYNEAVRAICAETATSLIDLSNTLDNGDFVDSNHLTVQGQERFRSLVMDEVLHHANATRPSSD